MRVDQLETNIDMIKYMHEPRSIIDICNNFGISEREFRERFGPRNDIKKIEFLDSEFPMCKRKIKGERRMVSDAQSNELIVDNDSVYKSTVHPIFLPLNLTEVFALTARLIDMTKGTYDQEIYQNIVSKIYCQLSNYAKNRVNSLFTDPNDVNLVNSFYSADYTAEEDESGIYKNSLMYLFKSDSLVKITYKNNSEDDVSTVRGKIRFSNGDYYIESENESICLTGKIINSIIKE